VSRALASWRKRVQQRPSFKVCVPPSVDNVDNNLAIQDSAQKMRLVLDAFAQVIALQMLMNRTAGRNSS
jgi:hypothetical protein